MRPPLNRRAEWCSPLLLTGCLLLLGHGLAAPLVYRVQRGDTAYSVARRFGLTVDALLAMNSLQSASISVGQALTIDLPGRAASSAPASNAGALPFVVAAPEAGRVRLVPEAAANTTPPGTPVAAVSTAPAQAASPSPQPAVGSGGYQVQRGDTAYSVARRFGLTVDALLAMNSLQASGLRVGQVLQVHAGGPLQAASPSSSAQAAPSSIVVTPLTDFTAPVLPATDGPGPVQTAPTASNTAPPADLGDPQGLALVEAGPSGSVRERLSHLLGVPYLYGGSTEQGVDCSGLVMQVFSSMGITVPRRSVDQYGAGVPVDRAALSEGDLVFFDTEGRGQVSHVGIYVGQDFFVHANSYDGRVTVNRLSERYYQTRYLGARRVMGLQVGMNSSATSRPPGSR